MKKWFLYQVFKQKRGLFYFFLIFIFGTAITNFMGWEATPFFVWGMYSEKEAEPATRQVISTVINDSVTLDYSGGISDANRFFLSSPLQFYLALKNTGDPTRHLLEKAGIDQYNCVRSASSRVLNNENSSEAFRAWYKRYIAQTTGINVRTISVIINETVIEPGSVKIISSERVESWE